MTDVRGKSLGEGVSSHKGGKGKHSQIGNSDDETADGHR